MYPYRSSRNPVAHDGTNLIRASHNDLFSSGTLGRYSSILNSVLERRLTLPYEEEMTTILLGKKKQDDSTRILSRASPATGVG